MMTPWRSTKAALASVALAVVVVAAGEAAEYRMHDGMRLPDALVTPGLSALGGGSAQAHACTVKWSKDVRHVTLKMKRTVCAAYGARACPGPRWEVDHLVPRQLLGADDITNLWPQPIAQARLKDRLENALHKDVCAGRLSIERAQHILRTDWYAEWKRRYAP